MRHDAQIRAALLYALLWQLRRLADQTHAVAVGDAYDTYRRRFSEFYAMMLES